MFAAGTALAVVQPGDLGDDEVASDTTTSTVEGTTTSTSSTTSTTATSTTLGPSGQVTSTTGATTSSTAATTTTTAPTTSTTAGSGIGANGSGTVRPDGTIADTGRESMLGAGLGLLGLGLVLRRVTRGANA